MAHPLAEAAMDPNLLNPAATITAALITNPAAGVSRSKLADVGALFASVYLELEKARSLIDKEHPPGVSSAS